MLVVGLAEAVVEEVQGDTIALLGTSDGDEALVGIVLRLVDLDNAATHLAYLVNLRSTLADNGADHVVGDVDLLRQGTARHATVHGLALGTTWTRSRGVGSGVDGDMGCSSTVRSSLGPASVVDGHGSGMMGWVGRVLLGIGSRGHMMRPGIMSPAIVLPVAVSSTGGLGAVRHNLHAAGDCASGPTAPGGVGRCCRATKTFFQLLQEGTANIVCCNVNSVGNAHDNKGALGGKREA